MRSAKPSTTAVLPTPASPVRIGLFWRRRVRMSMIWRISKSRPSTGSILPALALPVRSMVYWSRLGVLPPIGRGAPGAPPAAAGAAATVSSCEPATTPAKSFRSVSSWIFCHSLLTSRRMRARSSSSPSASTVKPVRICPALYSTEPISQASLSILTSDGLKAGVRALPDLSLSRLRPSSAARRDLSTPKAFRMRGKSESPASSSFMRKCSISTS